MDLSWQYSTIHNSPCKVIEKQTLWGQTVYRVWLPNQEAVVRVPESALRPLSSELQEDTEADRISYIAAAAKVAEVLEGSNREADGHVLLAPMESNVIPLPHQLTALSKAISGDRIRYLLADEVGLGKTVEAGLIMRELKLRGLVRRTLVVSPTGLIKQWQMEMETHFNEQLVALYPGPFTPYHQCYPDKNVWEMDSQIICPLDSVKPLDSRKGWSQERLDDYNRWRFLDLIGAGWDLVIIDEAHRLGGSTDLVARYKLGKGLAEAAPYVLLLSATPHQGKTDAFHRLMNLLDDKAFPDESSVTRDRVSPFVIRTEKRRAIDADGNPLFKPRRTQMAAIEWEDRHDAQRVLYDAVTDYVRVGYNQAIKDKKHHIGFLMILMQRLVVSSTRAIRTTLERRLAALKEGKKEATQLLLSLEDGASASEGLDELYDMDGQELLDNLLKSQMAALRNESAEVEALLEEARSCEQQGADAKAEALIEWIYQLQADESETDLKVLIFTEFVPTQQMLKEFLEARGISVATLNGSMGTDERKDAQDAFRGDTRVLVSTDAGGEGLNLQFCHVIINYDIPWNPMRLEQRIGRVDRIGQPKVVRAINFVFEDSVEYRVREVLEQKLSVIYDEFGIDKTGDVLDSAQAGELFEDVFATAFLKPEDIDASVDTTVGKIRDEIRMARESAAIYGISDEPDVQSAERLRSHPLPHWLEKMTVGYLRAHDGRAHRQNSWWDLKWPDGHEHNKCVFSSRDAERLKDATVLSLEDSRVRGLALNLPQLTFGQPLPVVSIQGLTSNVSGDWGLYEIRLQAGFHQHHSTTHIPMVRRGYVVVFVSDNGKLFLPTARHIWDALQTSDVELFDSLELDDAEAVGEKMSAAAEQVGKELFESLQQSHADSVAREEERGRIAFEARRNAIGRIGLPEVQQFRLFNCDAEEADWQKAIAAARQVVPEIRPLLLMRIAGGSN